MDSNAVSYPGLSSIAVFAVLNFLFNFLQLDKIKLLYYP
jgi:hypothetical protein